MINTDTYLKRNYISVSRFFSGDLTIEVKQMVCNVELIHTIITSISDLRFYFLHSLDTWIESS